jgi:hypothetical protein
MCAQTPNLVLDLLPANCTSFLQPLDVGLNKPMKHYLTKRWTERAIECYKNRVVGEPIVLIKPGRVQVANWVSDAWQGISQSSVLHSFIKVGLPVHDCTGEDSEDEGAANMVGDGAGADYAGFLDELDDEEEDQLGD